MRIVPVIDIKGGIVVHARRGQRAEYAPLNSPLVEGCDPVAVARVLCGVCRTRTLYVADLDALAGEPADESTLRALCAIAEPWVDAGATTTERAAALHRAGVARYVVGTESIGPGTEITQPVVLSVDLRDGRLISRDPALAGREPDAAVPLARALKVRELLVIDLARALPGVSIYAGGGVRDDSDLRALEAAGAAGALVATALHEGRITP